jgi:hypothetical protein
MLGIAAALAAALAGQAAVQGAQGVAYNRDIRPILSANCFVCHGPDKSHRQADLRLDVREVAVSNRPNHAIAIVPGRHADSALFQRITSTDPKTMMPPPTSEKKLTPREIALLTQWLDQGAVYEQHWAYLPPRRPPVPALPGTNAINDIDRFILSRLAESKLAPSPSAERHTLIRRLSLDLTGLPPTPEEVAAFVADPAPDAYDKLVERLLASPHYGERMAVPWLDAVRFADTVGYHGDENQNIYPYRDYVIDAFNRNKPFDQFTIEQIAGDLLPDPTVEQRVATGFNRLNMLTREGGAQPKEYLAKYAADRVRTVSGAWLGSTMGCAECHDHKFDPFTQKDFYSMAAFFADVTQWGVYADYPYTPEPELKGIGVGSIFPPEIEVDTASVKQRRNGLWQQVLAAAAATNADPAAFETWRAESAAVLNQFTNGWITPTASGVDFAAEAGGWLVSTGKPAERAQVTLAVQPGWLAAIRLELQPRGEGGGGIWSGGTNRNVTLKLTASLAQKPLVFRYADAYPKKTRFAGNTTLIGVLDGWSTLAAYAHQPHAGFWILDQPVRVAAGESLTLVLEGAKPSAIRVSLTPFAPQASLSENWSAGLREALAATPPPPLARAAHLAGTAWDAGAFAKYKALFNEMFGTREGRAYSMVTEARAPAVTRVLPRGNWQDDSGEVVAPGVPHFLPQPGAANTQALTRLDLARWLVATNQPLTGRAVMNRMWKQFFGSGLSAMAEDLGAQGEWPVHPDLLDWLAAEFRDSGWDVKHMVRLMVTSATYRQRSNPAPAVHELDPQTRLLASQAPRRLEAEFVRDNALFIAGLLNLDVGGPSAKPYQPAGYYANLQFPDRDYVADKDSRQYRRGLYTHWQRTFLHPMLANFDAPSREESACSRTVANTPQQALTLLNDPTFVEAARVFAAQVLAAPATSDDERLELVYRKTLARPPATKERQSLAEFLGVQRAYFMAHPEDAKKSVRVGLSPVPVGTNAPGVDAALADWERRLAESESKWVVLDPESFTATAGSFAKQADRSWLAVGPAAATDTYTITARTALQGITGVRLEAMADPSLPAGGPGRAANGNFVLSEFKMTANGQPVAFSRAEADFSQVSFPVVQALDGKAGDTGWAVMPSFNQTHAAVFQIRTPVGQEGETLVVFTLDHTSQYAGHSIGRVRLSVTSAPDPGGIPPLPGNIAAVLAMPPAQRTAQQRQELIDFSGVLDSERAAWAQVCRVVLNLHETITRY